MAFFILGAVFLSKQKKPANFWSAFFDFKELSRNNLLI